MTFLECVMECAKAPGIVEQFNRLTGRHLGEKLVRHPLEVLVDKSTGYDQVLAAQQEEDVRAFVEFCHECVWIRIAGVPPQGVTAPAPSTH